jgi:hypothetical protein
MMRYVLFMAVVGLAGAFLAAHKGRNPLLWFLLCALAPLLLLALAMLPSLPVRGSTQKCPSCAMLIPAVAKKCRYCGEQQPVDMVGEK